MHSTPWILIDTETNGLTPPIFVVELAAQRMNGWQAQGPAFRRLLNQNADIAPEASRIHGYTREILERDGEDPRTVYLDFADYAGDLPLVSYNLAYDLDQVLLPEWQRLNLSVIGRRGLCVYRLAQRLLDPIPAGNCKLQTLRQYYRLPERGAHTALGDVQTVTDLLDTVLRPIVERQQLTTWQALVDYLNADWYPSRLAFGKYKGRDFRDALTDPDLRQWLHWLASSRNARSAAMARWYLDRLEQTEVNDDHPPQTYAATDSNGLVVFVDAELAQLKNLIVHARDRLAELEAEYTQERHAVDVTQASLFNLLREHYQQRDRLRLIVDYRQRFLETLLREGEEQAEQCAKQFEQAQQQSEQDYEKAAAQTAEQRALTGEETQELNALWKKLVRVFHPDRFHHDPSKQAAYDHLTRVINRARDQGDIETLREIANHPNEYMQRNGYSTLDFSDSLERSQLLKLHQSLESRILMTIEALSALRLEPSYELHHLVLQNPYYLSSIAQDHITVLNQEIAELEQQADDLADEIEDLTGMADCRVR
ncbi:MAG: hypothetical protein Q7U98_03410 [Methylicorpusculum sp.]|uniref:exonuclease domain-containing protein n=1 Tax=Methylicorpusculum sp. TaxID=2713644 RepID=UPI00271CB3FC|nr:exonuclease domain-containing protein [Methylicorpusculum sp.]MDO8844418.1 hypothetical protein [Methylicorpusculum sp.]MDO8938186.1 hypothetical protein [Methylicorpusculum sp.]MDP2178825.1 hypothetical protein [Methylicorpusculum sp.]MDP3529105.1 hypothetical protein [Methylicorpusculum sp.]MDZ4149900.1 hypothetical protein [Methylicorpusculum sp.]